MTNYAYARTSTLAQDGLGQTHELSEEAGIPPERVTLDRGLSGYSKPAMERPGFRELYGKLAAGDVIIVPDLARMGRDALDVLTVAKALDAKDVGLVILSVGGAQIDTRTSLGKFFLLLLAGIAELTRNQIADNTRLKLQALKAAGVYPETTNPNRKAKAGDPVILGARRKLSDSQAATVATMKARGLNVSDIASALSVSERTVWRYLKRAEEAVSA
jgi:DNA invertase Pin-like site-specific DNA recombinase